MVLFHFSDFGSLYQRRCGVISCVLSRQPHFRPCRCGDFGFVSAAQASRTSHSRCFLQLQTFCCGRRELSLKDVAASQYVFSRGADNLSSYVSSFGSDLSSTCFGWCWGRCRLHQGLRSPVGDCVPLLRSFTVDNKSDEALRRNGGPSPRRDGKRVSS